MSLPYSVEKLADAATRLIIAYAKRVEKENAQRGIR